MADKGRMEQRERGGESWRAGGRSGVSVGRAVWAVVAAVGAVGFVVREGGGFLGWLVAGVCALVALVVLGRRFRVWMVVAAVLVGGLGAGWRGPSDVELAVVSPDGSRGWSLVSAGRALAYDNGMAAAEVGGVRVGRTAWVERYIVPGRPRAEVAAFVAGLGSAGWDMDPVPVVAVDRKRREWVSFRGSSRFGFVVWVRSAGRGSVWVTTMRDGLVSALD